MKYLAVVVASLLATPATAGEAIRYKAGDDTMKGFRAKPAGDSKGLVLILHDWDGLTEYEMKRAEMIAELGYEAFAADLYGEEVRPSTLEDKKAETAKLYADRPLMRARIGAALETATQNAEGTVVIAGYCFGGSAALEWARHKAAGRVAGVAVFHGGLKTPDGQSYSATTPPLFIAHGGADTSVPISDVAQLSVELEAAKVPYTMEIYSGAPHAFTVFESERYQKAADEKSWNAFIEFLSTQTQR